MAVVRDYINGQFNNDELEPVGIGGFNTAAIVREGIRKTRDVPVTPLEDGSFVNDHIIRNPLVLSIEGEVSDVFVLPQPAIKALTDAQANIGLITQYAPDRTQSQVQKVNGIVADLQNNIDAVDAVIESGQRFANYVGFTGDEGKTNIERFIDFVDSVHDSDVLIVIDAPFRTYENMAVTSFEYTRNNEKKSLDFTIEAQEFRFAQTIFSEVTFVPARNTKGQADGETDKGVQEGVEQETGFAKALINRLKGEQ